MDTGDLGRHQRHRRVDEDLTGEAVADILERRSLVRERHGQHDDIPRSGGRRVRLAGDLGAGHRGAQLGGGGVGLRLGPGTDDDGVAGAGPASRESGTEGSGATDDGDRLDLLRCFHFRCVLNGCGERAW